VDAYEEKIMKNSVLLNYVIKSIYEVASRRTSSNFADETIGSSIRTLEGKYDFLKHVKITSKDFSGGGLVINVSNDVNDVYPTLVGKAIEAIIRVVYNDLNEEAGLYFISELKQIAGDEITRGIMERNVDLEQVQMEQHYAHRRRDRKKAIQKAIENGENEIRQPDNLLGYTWSNVSKWKTEQGGKFCILYDKNGKVLDRLSLDRIIQNYVEKLSSFVDIDPKEVEKQTRIYEKEYNLLKLMLERDMDAEVAMRELNISMEELNDIIKKLSSMEILHYVDHQTIELTEVGVSYISKKDDREGKTA